MQKILLYSAFLILLSCGKQAKESKENSETTTAQNVTALPIQRDATILLDTAIARKLSKKEMNTIFTNKRQIQLGISNEVYQAYTYKDDANEYYLVLTDHRKNITKEKDTLYDNVYALNLINNNYQFKKRSTIKGEIDGDWETSIGFWNQYSELSDLDGDGTVDPIIVYGTTGQNKYKDGRVRIVAYHQKKRVTIKHQNSEIEDGRITKINKNFYNFPIEIQEAVKAKMKLMIKNGHAFFVDEWEKDMQNKATRLEKM
ncbi:M949_RS01915 family surface polysaccharide biosynthesis protein [Aquimarina sp. SS2-1]|uniref:M949_RS01915 family surface polysaccharide biosynthesis protein n=1 Tax=Aquimarina besae TaxID=3342247 RepID=UPI003672F914